MTAGRAAENNPRRHIPPRFGAIVAVTVLVVMGLGIVAPVLPSFAREFNLSGAASAALLSSFALGRLIFAVPGGALADRFGFRPVAVVGCLVTSMTALLAAITHSYGVLIVAQIGQGMGSALYTTAAMAALIAIAPSNAIGRLLALYQGTILAGMSLAPLVGGVAARFFGVSGPFWIYAVGSGAGAVISAVYLPTVASTGAPARARGAVPVSGASSVGAVLRSRPFLLSLLASFATFWAVAGVRNTLVPLFASAEFGFDDVANGALLMVAALANIVALGPGGRAVDELGRRPVVRWGVVSLAATTSLFVLVTAPWMLVGAVALAGVSKGVVSTAPMAVVADIADEDIRATAVGISRLGPAIGLTVGPMMTGWMADLTSLRVAFGISAVLLALTSLITGRIPESMRRGPSPT